MNTNNIFNIKNEQDFQQKVFEVFEYQYQNIHLYQDFCNFLKKTPNKVKRLNEIPFLPISFFKTHKICSLNKIEAIFESSGTTSNHTSKHYIANLSLYEQSFRKGFNLFYGDYSKYLWLALMPNKNLRPNSSLIYMVEKFIESSLFTESDFYLGNEEKLFQILLKTIENKTPTIVIGLTYALLDFAEKYKLPKQNNIIVIETGGMKGKRKEILREELHNILKSSFKVDFINSEYGMTELLSQAYSKGNGLFKSPPWMKILIRDLYNPQVVGINNSRGGINIIDLANIYSCSFIETEDLGISYSDGSFEVLGRINSASVRGCNTMID